MGCARENQAENVVLANVTQALEQGVVDNLDLMPVKRNSAMDRVHDQFVISPEQVIDGTSHRLQPPKNIKHVLLYHRGVPK